MKVWIDQDLCTGDGLCEEIAPSIFTLLDDGLAYVKDGDKVLSEPGGAEGLAGFLVHPYQQGVRAPAPPDHEVQFGLVDQHAVLDDVTRRPAVEGEELVSGPQSGQVGR